MITLRDCEALDTRDPLAALRDQFEPAPAGTIFLDGNSVGAMPKGVPERLQRAVSSEWSALRRKAWHEADWLDAPQRIGAGMAALVGAPPTDVIAVDNTTLNLHKLLAYGLQLAAAEDPNRNVIVYEPEGFPTDAHVVQGIVHHGSGRWMARAIDGADELAGALADNRVAMVLIAHVDYRSSWRYDMLRTPRPFTPPVPACCGTSRTAPASCRCRWRHAVQISPSLAATSTSPAGRAPRRSPTSAATCKTAPGPRCPAGSGTRTA
jgi:kynureninase